MFTTGQADDFVGVVLRQLMESGVSVDGSLEVFDLFAWHVADEVASIPPGLMVEVLAALHLADLSSFHPLYSAHLFE
jgi:hypothetical protein